MYFSISLFIPVISCLMYFDALLLQALTGLLYLPEELISFYHYDISLFVSGNIPCQDVFGCYQNCHPRILMITVCVILLWFLFIFFQLSGCSYLLCIFFFSLHLFIFHLPPSHIPFLPLSLLPFLLSFPSFLLLPLRL